MCIRDRKYFDLNHDGSQKYDAKERRGTVEPDFSFVQFRVPRKLQQDTAERKGRSDSHKLEKQHKTPHRRRDFSNARIEHSVLSSNKDLNSEINFVKLKRIEEIIKENEDDEKEALRRIRALLTKGCLLYTSPSPRDS
eukprot:TRINITY_DN10723_c0_g1_i2.p1 TRINITY_DN10723_c0_g1~~TRINITY_DN10723_c0_g1_i2.p1  ORF type:complete len:138 (-),score=29.80 TRINITY_DN10723_c0_g1_i2:37-450(-)